MTDYGVRTRRRASLGEWLGTVVLFLVPLGIGAFEIYTKGPQTWPELLGLAIVAIIIETVLLVLSLPLLWLMAPKRSTTTGADPDTPRRPMLGMFAVLFFVALWFLSRFFWVAGLVVSGPQPVSWRPDRWASEWPAALSYHGLRFVEVNGLVIVVLGLAYFWVMAKQQRQRRQAHDRPPPLSLDRA